MPLVDIHNVHIRDMLSFVPELPIISSEQHRPTVTVLSVRSLLVTFQESKINISAEEAVSSS